MLTELLFLCCPEQVPKGFCMCPVPQEIVSWTLKTLQLSTKPEQDPKEPISRIIGVMLNRRTSFPASNSDMARSWMLSHPGYDQESLSAFLRPLGIGSFQEEIKRFGFSNHQGGLGPIIRIIRL